MWSHEYRHIGRLGWRWQKLETVSEAPVADGGPDREGDRAVDVLPCLRSLSADPGGYGFDVLGFERRAWF